jgi:hypothetical protein
VETAGDKYLCPSVFSPSKMTTRRLNTLELGSMFHVPQFILKALPASLGLSFIQAIPGSLAVTLWENSNLFTHSAINQLKGEEVKVNEPSLMLEPMTSHVNKSASSS